MKLTALSVLLVSLMTTLVADGNLVQPDLPQTNLATVATPSTSFVSGHETLEAVNNGATPRNSGDTASGIYGNWPQTGEQWVQLAWPAAVTTDGVAIYWFEDTRGIRCPESARLMYQQDDRWIEIPAEVGVAKDGFNVVRFESVTTTALRLVMVGRDNFSTGVIEWRVFDEGSSPDFPPQVTAGPDRTVVVGGRTYLNAMAKGTGKAGATEMFTWSKVTGPGKVTFADATALRTTATFSEPGDYVLRLETQSSSLTSSDQLSVHVRPAPMTKDVHSIYTRRYSIQSEFWQPRIRNLIVNWIPHCIAKCDDPSLAEGGINNLIEAGKKLRGEPYKAHVGYPFSNAWVLNTIEAMCIAQMVDPQGDAEIAKAQEAMREKLEEWIPILLAAQEPDGYFQTRITLGLERERDQTVLRWEPRLRTEHEGYVAGYFIEAGIAHYLATNGQDRRLYDAAKGLADVWYDNIGPAPKKPWYDGHQGMEIALFRLARLVNDVEGDGAGDKYAELAKFLLDCRGTEVYPIDDTIHNHGLPRSYDQSHLPVTQQYTAEGHAVRAVYNYTAMAEVARRWGDTDYQSAVFSIWDNLVNRKHYITGGVGSGETAEGFGEDYSLPNNAYCESCAGIGELFFQHQMNLLTAEAPYADLYEETLYNAILSDIDLEGQNFTYTNALDTSESRYKWHICPCCVGNIPRALLMLPTWTYVAGANDLYVNLYIGSTMRVPDVGGTDVEIVQATDYPHSGTIAITLNPAEQAAFALHLRVPDRSVSELYHSTPEARGYLSVKVNGEAVSPETEAGYIVLKRNWAPGDRVELELPMPVQRVRTINEVVANRGRVALRRGPLIFNIEAVDQDVEAILPHLAPLRAEFVPDLLQGVMTIRGSFEDGSDLLAIPNYARNNRGGRSIVWIREEAGE